MICVSCKQIRPDDDHYQVKNLCRGCQKMRAKRSRQKERGKEVQRVYSKARYQKFRHKYLARAKVKQAVAKGLITKPKLCTACLTETLLHAHHPDYNKPLYVVWLCDICHKAEHNRLVDRTLMRATSNN